MGGVELGNLLQQFRVRGSVKALCRLVIEHLRRVGRWQMAVELFQAPEAHFGGGIVPLADRGGPSLSETGKPDGFRPKGLQLIIRKSTKNPTAGQVTGSRFLFDIGFFAIPINGHYFPALLAATNVLRAANCCAEPPDIRRTK